MDRRSNTWSPLRGHEAASEGLAPNYPLSRGNRSFDLGDYEPEQYQMTDHRGSHTALLSNEEDLFDNLTSNQHAERSLDSPKIWNLNGWQVGVLACASVAGAVCILNISRTIWAVHNHHDSDGLSYLFYGSCTEVANISLWSHLLINAMSTLLLSASNYTMQVISSPTRKDIDAAHAKSIWLDIGVPSVRNISRIPLGRVAMWMMLALSSVPLHLMYNTAVFTSLAANNYNYIVTTKDFFNSAPKSNISSEAFRLNTTIVDMMSQKAINGSLIRYELAACQAMYGTAFVSKIRNVVLVTNDTSSAYNVLGGQPANLRDYYGIIDTPYVWICGDGFQNLPWSSTDFYGQGCGTANYSNVTNWTLFGYRLSYCMVEEAEEHCSLNFSLPIMIVVIAANVVKLGIMLLTVWKLGNRPLVTIGDAVASFLEVPDITTKNQCLSSKGDIQSGDWPCNGLKTWSPRRFYWFKAASGKRWHTCNLMCVAFVSVGVAFLVSGMSTVGADEWSRFSHIRKPLRVTFPKGQQRSTYWLSLPYTFAIPLLITSGVLHWLMSQSLFLALVNVYDDTVNYQKDQSFDTVGFSCIAIFTCIVVWTVAIIGAFITGFRKYPAGIPVVGSCSAAISAACHPPKDDTLAYLQPVMWGLVNQAENGVGHCRITSMEVTEPVDGQLYAGRRRGKV